ncbi:MAG: hypothetical protein QOI02_962 [Actinomycetota bacterium]|nr:hypothetical protein [Actinomycetota bacterium]
MARTGNESQNRDESSFPTGRFGDREFHTSRPLYSGLAVVIKRFPADAALPADARNFVLVHGIGVSSRYFHPLAAELAKLGQVWLVDLPGYGSAPDPHRDVTIADHAATLGAFLADRGIPNPVLVGHSMGTQVVSRLAVDAPQTTDRVVLIAPTMDPEARTFPRAAGRLIRDFAAENLRANLVVFTDYMFRCGVPYFFRQLPHLFNDQMEHRLPELAARTLVLRGDKDGVSPEAWTSRVSSLIPDSTLITVKGPHIVMYTDPKLVAERIAVHAA